MGNFSRYAESKSPFLERENMRSLIVNIDDVGTSNAVNEAAKTCCRKNEKFGVSLMACGRAFDDACDMLDSIGKSEVGVHLTLTGGFTPCTENKADIKSILNEKDVFASDYAALTAKYFQRKLNIVELYLELRNQVKAVKEKGFEITHLDGHEHINMLPLILKITIRLALEFDVPYIRLSREKIDMAKKEFKMKDLVRLAALRLFSAGGEKAIKKEGISCNDNFLGHFHAGRMNEDILKHMLENIPEGLTELAFHPAIRDEEFIMKNPWYKNAPEELYLLVHTNWEEELAKNSVLLTTH